jgi:polar amino acid transport system substrate-binding protein
MLVFWRWLVRVVFLSVIVTDSIALARNSKDLVLVADPWCPFTCDANAGPQGMMIDIARAILEPLGYRVTYENVGWTRALKGTAAGDYDAAVGTSLYEAPELVMSTAPLGKMENGIFVLASDPWRFTTLDSLTGRKLGIIMGYSYGESLDRYFLDNPDSVEVKSGEDALRKNILQLVNKRIDAVIDDVQVIAYTLQAMQIKDTVIQASSPGALLDTTFDIEKDGLFIGISPKHPEAKAIAEALGKGIEVLRSNGELAKILARYNASDWKAPKQP